MGCCEREKNTKRSAASPPPAAARAFIVVVVDCSHPSFAQPRPPRFQLPLVTHLNPDRAKLVSLALVTTSKRAEQAARAGLGTKHRTINHNHNAATSAPTRILTPVSLRPRVILSCLYVLPHSPGAKGQRGIAENPDDHPRDQVVFWFFGFLRGV